MNENNEFDYTVTKKPEGGYLVKRLLMILLYVVFGAVYFFGLALAHLYPLMAFIILLEWILVFFTWRFVSIEYRYETASGAICFYEVYGGKKKKLYEPIYNKYVYGYLYGGIYRRLKAALGNHVRRSIISNINNTL